MQKSIGYLACVLLLAACSFNIEVTHHHDHVPDVERRLAERSTVGREVGVVLDGDARPVKARMHLVYERGSKSWMTGDDGRFEIVDAPAPAYVIVAATEDDRLAYVPKDRRRGEPLCLVVRPATTLAVDSQGRTGARLAAFHRGSRVADFTLAPGVNRCVVPAGKVELVTYDGDEVLERRRCTFEPGGPVPMSLRLDARD